MRNVEYVAFKIGGLLINDGNTNVSSRLYMARVDYMVKWNIMLLCIE